MHLRPCDFFICPSIICVYASSTFSPIKYLRGHYFAFGILSLAFYPQFPKVIVWDIKYFILFREALIPRIMRLVLIFFGSSLDKYST